METDRNLCCVLHHWRTRCRTRNKISIRIRNFVKGIRLAADSLTDRSVQRNLRYAVLCFMLTATLAVVQDLVVTILQTPPDKPRRNEYPYYCHHQMSALNFFMVLARLPNEI
jgi:hypothetical protein